MAPAPCFQSSKAGEVVEAAFAAAGEVHRIEQGAEEARADGIHRSEQEAAAAGFDEDEGVAATQRNQRCWKKAAAKFSCCCC